MVWANKEVVATAEEVEDDVLQIALEDAVKYNKKAKVGENVKIGKFCKLIGELRPAVVLSGSILDANVEVLGATVGENTTVTVNKKIVEDVDGGTV